MCIRDRPSGDHRLPDVCDRARPAREPLDEQLSRREGQRQRVFRASCLRLSLIHIYPRKQKYKNLKYQIKEVELARLEKANVPMLTQTEKQYRNHAIKFANWCKEQYGCRTLDECSAHIQDYADFLVVQGRSPSTIHTYLAGICRICGVPLADIQKPIRVVAENTRSRGMKAVDERKDAGREASPRLDVYKRHVYDRLRKSADIQ